MQVSRFKGLNTAMDLLRMGVDWLTQADNINITDTGGMVKREGYDRTQTGSITSLYGTIDETRMYGVVGGVLKSLTRTAAVSLQTLTSTAMMHWSEINDQVFFNNGVDRGIIEADNRVIPWAWTPPSAPNLLAVAGSMPAGLYRVAVTFTLPDGRMTGASEPVGIELDGSQALQLSAIPQVAGYTTNVWICPANSTVFGLAARNAPAALVWNASPDSLGRELQHADAQPLPAGCDVIQAWRGRMYAAQYFPELGQSAIWQSKALGFHLFDVHKDGLMVPGRVLMLAPHDAGLVIGTDRAIHAYSGEAMSLLAPYGVVPGQHWSEDEDKTVIFWSSRGVCRALPFLNLTQQNVSAAPGIRAGGAIVRQGGQKRYLAAIQQGGSAFNAF